MKLRGLTPVALAARLRINRGSVYRWMAGRGHVPVHQVLAVAAALDCDPGWLFFGDRRGAITETAQLQALIAAWVRGEAA
jgi:transcriptional regulator with XRE-family HTH domain